MIPHAKNSVCATILFFCLTGIANGKETDPPNERMDELLSLGIEELRHITVTASRDTESTILAPGTVYVITEEDINRHGWRHLQDALRVVPSIYLYDPHSWVWGGQRGLLSNFSQTLLMINGREVNNLIASEGFISRQFTTHNIEQVEVMASPGSALYGANALAGVINIITREANRNFEGFEMSLDYGSFGSKGTSFVFGENLGRLRFSGSGMVNVSDEEDFLDFVRDEEEFSRGWADYSLAIDGIKSYENPTKGESLNLQLDYKGAYIGLNHYRNKESYGLEYLRWDYADGNDHRQMDLLFGGINAHVGDDLTLKAEYQHTKSKLWGQYSSGQYPKSQFESPDGVDLFEFAPSDFVDPLASFAQNLVNNGYLNPLNITETDIRRLFTHLYSNKNSKGSTRDKVELQANWIINQRARLLLGYTFDEISYVGLALTDGATGTGASLDVPLDSSKRKDVYDSYKHGVFLQFKYDLLVDRLFLTSGVRLDDQNHYGSNVNPRLGLVWIPRKKHVIKVLYGEAFREPNVFELASDPGARPAKLRSYEVNYSQALTDRARISATGYHNTVTNFPEAIGSVIGTGIASVEKLETTGMEFEAEATFDKWQGFVNGSLIFEGTQDLLDEVSGKRKTRDLLSLSEQRVNAGLTYSFRPELSASILYSHSAAYDAISGNPAISEVLHIGAANKVDVTLSLRDREVFGQKVSGFLTVTNLTDEKIFEANIRRSGPHQFLQDGRAVYLRLTTNWRSD